MEEGSPAAVARALVVNAARVKRGENVVIETWNHTLAFASACVVEARRQGAHPFILFEDELAFWRSVDALPSGSNWGKPGAHEWAAVDRAHAYISFPGPADRPRYHALPSQQAAQLSFASDEWIRRAKRHRLRGVRALLGYASDAQAAFWGVSSVSWKNQLIRAMVEPDYGKIQKDAQLAAQKLARAKVVRVTAANGSDVSVKLRGRAPWVDDGVLGPDDLQRGHPMTAAPPGSVAVAVDEKSATGTAIASRPSYLGGGRVEGGQWELADGRLTNFWYTDGQTSFEEDYAAAPKGHDVLSILSLGINPSLVAGVPQAEDQELGAVTLAVGGNTDYGGSNRCAFLSWIVIGEATVAVDGEPLCDRGKILSGPDD